MDAENRANSPRRRPSEGRSASRRDRRTVGGTVRPPLAEAIGADFRARIGEDRHDVWFGERLDIAVERLADDSWQVTVLAGTSFTHEWLQRTFRDDFAASVERVLPRSAGPVAVVWGAAASPGGVTGQGSPVEPAPVEVVEVTRVAPPPDRRGGNVRRDQRRSAGAEGHGAGQEGTPAKGGAPGRRSIDAEVRSTVVPSGEQCQPIGRPTGPVRPALTLEHYVVGAGNRMAHAAAALAAEQPGAMSPLVIHGPSGVGKTHLLEGICRRTRERFPRAATVMLSAEQFTTTFLETLHGRRGLPGFRRSLRAADLLVIDDIQFLIGKKATISELLHTLDTLHRAGKQVVFASDRDVEALADLGADLQARLRGGMCARVLPPDESTRVGIVESLAERRGLAIPSDVVAFVAARMTRNTRELAGAVNRLEATSHMLGIPVTLDMAEESLAELVRSSTRAVRIADIERAVCTALGVDPGSLQSSCRVRRVNHPRMLAMFLARKHTPAALAEIGAYFGRRSHSTVISAQRIVDGWIASGSRLTLADAEWGIEEAIRRVEENLRVG